MVRRNNKCVIGMTTAFISAQSVKLGTTIQKNSPFLHQISDDRCN
jgi:hypothetical protein